MTTALTLERSRDMIAELEKQLERAVQQFHDTTGLRVYNLNLSETDVSIVAADHNKYFYRVKVEVTL